MADNDAVMAVLDKYDAGILGEERDGTLRVAFSRTCEMVNRMADDLKLIGYELIFPHNTGSILFLNLVSAQEHDPKEEKLDLAEFTHETGQMGVYTLSKKLLGGTRLVNLFDQVDGVPLILEDEPGTDRLYLHVELGKDSKNSKNSKNLNPLKDLKDLNDANYLPWLFVLAIFFPALFLLLANIEWALKMASTVCMKLLTVPCW